VKNYKILSLIVCIVMTISLLFSGCGKKETAVNNDVTPSVTAAAPTNTTDNNSTAATPTEVVSPTAAASVTPSVTGITKKPDTTVKPTTGPSPTKSTVTVTPKAADGKAITIEGSGVSKAVSFTLSDLKSNY
jgi:PBP1b-binding outer membrane lipoprotein LpoB